LSDALTGLFEIEKQMAEIKVEGDAGVHPSFVDPWSGK
jgi:hypothetical protein